MKKEKLVTKVMLTDSVGVKEFRALMAKHKIKINDESTVEGNCVFTLDENEDRLEDILVATHLSWDFYWK
jgi:hypothetical protein